MAYQSILNPMPVTFTWAGLTDAQLRATPVPTAGTVADVTATGTLAAAAQTVTLSMAGGMSAAAIQITGTWVGTIQFEGTVDGTNWVPINGVFAGGTAPGPTITVNGVIRLTPSALASMRVNMTAFTSGTATITMRAGRGTGGVFANQSLPVGTNTIGNVGLVAGAAVIGAVTQSGTWNVGSITTLPALATGANVIGGVTQSGTWNIGTLTTLPALVTGAAIIGKVGIDQTTPGTTNLVSIGTNGTVAINAALPTGANTIGTVNIAAAQTIAVTQATAANLNMTATPVTPTASIITSAATTNATSIKASAGTLYSITVSNAGAAAAFVKIYNSATAPTVGTTSIALTIPVAASGVVNINFGHTGMRLGTGIALAITNLVGEADATAVAVNQVKVLTSYI